MKGNIRQGEGRYICSRSIQSKALPKQTADIGERTSSFGSALNTEGFEYEGQWDQNLRHGLGRCFFYNGELYIGQWQNNKMHGRGTYFYRKGERYEGDWLEGEKHGPFSIWSADKSLYRGNYKNGKKHGIW